MHESPRCGEGLLVPVLGACSRTAVGWAESRNMISGSTHPAASTWLGSTYQQGDNHSQSLKASLCHRRLCDDKEPLDGGKQAIKCVAARLSLHGSQCLTHERTNDCSSQNVAVVTCERHASGMRTACKRHAPDASSRWASRAREDPDGQVVGRNG